MSVPLRLGVFVAVLVVAFGAAFGVGAAVGPLDDADTTGPVRGAGTEMQMDHDGG